MAAGNAGRDVVDYLVMWIHQRTGPNTAISFGLGTLIFGVLVVGYLCAQVWPVLLGLAVIGLMIYTWNNRHGYVALPESETDDEA